MRNLGVPPTVNQLDTQYTTDFLKTLAERHSYYSGTTNPTVSQIPNKQWIVFKNTTNGEVRLWTNDNGTLKSVLLNTNTTYPAFFAFRTTNQSVASATNTKILFDTVDFDSTSSFSVVNSRWTPGVAGLYHVTATTSNGVLTGNTDPNLMEIWKNGSGYIRGTQVNGGAGGLNACIASAELMLTSTDYLEVFVFIGGTSPLVNGSTFRITHFSGSLIRPL